MNAGGDFVVVWYSRGSFGGDTHFNSAQGQRYKSDGSMQGAQFQVNTYTTGGQEPAGVTMEADGDFVVAWESFGSFETDSSYSSVQVQRFGSDGSAQGAQFQVNTFTTWYQSPSSVATGDDGNFVVVWTTAGPFGVEAQGRRYSTPAGAPPVAAMSPATRFALGAALLLLGMTFALRRREGC
jgi:hypothetical protein